MFTYTSILTGSLLRLVLVILWTRCLDDRKGSKRGKKIIDDTRENQKMRNIKVSLRKTARVICFKWELLFYPQLRTFFPFPFCFLEVGGSERERDRNINVREKHQLIAFSYVPQPGIKPATWVYALTRN